MLAFLKKITCGTVAAMLVLGLCACSSSKNKSTEPTDPEIVTLPTAPIEETAPTETNPL